MTTEPAIPKPVKPAAKQPSPLEEGSMRVHALHFRGGVDIPHCEQQVARISEVPRAGKHTYRISFLPRIDKFLVRAFGPDRPEAPPVATFMIPADWALAEFPE